MVNNRDRAETEDRIPLSRRSMLSLTGSGMLATLGGGAFGSYDTASGMATDQSTVPTVGANYYPWYGRGTHVDWTDETPEDPILGEYDSRDPEIIDQHLEWCRTYGIDWLSMSWWGQNSPEDVTIRDHILPRSQSDVEFSIFYETPGLLTATDNNTYDLDSSENRNQIVGDVEYLSETYFTNSQYRRIDGRPVLYLYIAGTFRGDIEAAFDAMRSASPDGLYIIADLIRFGPPLDKDIPILEAADAVTSYNMYAPLDDINDNFVDRATDVYDDWVDPLANANTEFIPVSIPGYDDTELEHVSRDNPPLEASPDLFREFCQKAQPYVTNGANSIFITSFNEWYENTQVEPSGSFGTEYLEVIQDEFDTETDDTATDEPIEIALQFNRTVSEDELTDGIENPRELALQSFEISITDETGYVVESFDIGVESNEPEFGSGVYQPEELSESDGVNSTWRWFGGPDATTTFYLDSSLDSARSLVVHGGAAEGTIDVTILRNGEQTDTQSIEGRPPEDYQFSLSRPEETETKLELQFSRTVAEESLVDGIEDPRELAVRGFELAMLDDAGEAVTSYDIGIEGEEPAFGIGAYLREQLPDTDGTDGSWRWFGGSQARTTMYFDGSIDDIHSLVLRAGTVEGAVDVSVLRNGELTDNLTIDGREPNDYELTFASPKTINDRPVIDNYSVSEVGSTDPHLEMDADWEVSDENGNLDTVILQLLHESGAIADAATIDVSGHSASSSTGGLSVEYVDGKEFRAVLTVVDTYGQSVSETQMISE